MIWLFIALYGVSLITSPFITNYFVIKQGDYVICKTGEILLVHLMMWILGPFLLISMFSLLCNSLSVLFLTAVASAWDKIVEERFKNVLDKPFGL